MKKVQWLQEVARTQAVKSLRFMMFTTVHQQYPSLCDGLQLRTGENRIGCGNCGWEARFHDGSVRVKQQIRHD